MCESGFIALEQLLSKLNGGKDLIIVLTIKMTMADICLVPQVYNANRFGVDMSKFPNIQRINDNCMKLKAFQDADPSKMIDAIPPSKL